MLVNETFVSLQGEGGLVGVPSFFIRTAGCNLRCRWCDTPHSSWRPEGERRSVAALVAEARAAAVDHVVVTGGEPLLQRDICALTRQLQRAALHVTVETAGTVAPDFVCDLLSLSPKLANSDPGGPWRDRHRRARGRLAIAADLLARAADYQVKLVIVDQDDLPAVLALLAELGVSDRRRVILMAEGRSAAEVAARAPLVASLCVEHGFRYTPRLHLDLWGGRRGT